MSFTIETGKETGLIQINVVPKPLVLCQLTAVDGDTCYLTTTPELGGATRVYGGNTYQARLQANPIDTIQAQSPEGYDIPGSINLTIADGDFAIWGAHANAHGWRGGTLTVTFVLWDAITGTYSTNAYIWTFILDKANVDATGVITVAAQARQSMTRLTVPNFARQNRCGQTFPTTAAQRAAALNDPTSISYGCAYSPDQAGGLGNTTTANLVSPDGTPLTDSSGIYLTCDLTRSSGALKTSLTQGCMARLGNYSATVFFGTSIPCALDGDIIDDESGRRTGHFTGDTLVQPDQWTGKQYVNPQSGKQYGFNTPNPATGATYYNQGYGTQWVTATVLAPAGDPNTNRVECVVCLAPVGPATIKKVIVNGMEVLSYTAGADALFCYHILITGSGTTSMGGRSGTVNTDAIYDGQGDPHGSMCWFEIVVPFELSASGSIPNVQVLVQFPQCLHANTGGGFSFYYPTSVDPLMVDSAGAIAENPVWALMDLLTWGPFTTADFDTQTWYDASLICSTQIGYKDINGNSATHARYRCSFALQNGNRLSLAKAVRGLRNCAGIILARNPTNGLLQCFIEQTLADQQPSAIAGSNYSVAVSSLTAAGTAADGYLAYLFDGAGSIEAGTFKLGGLTLNNTPNTVAFPFQDSANVWVQDSCTTIDQNGYVTSGNQEIGESLEILGIENFDQATRRSNVELAKALYGNSRFDAGGTDLPSFRSTVKGAHLASRLGCICGITYQQLSL
jgi:hypothetical protein